MPNEISFKSRIVPMSISQYGNVISQIGSKYHANYPWGINNSVVGKDVYTRNICDCTSCLITDGNKAVLMHLNPENSINHCFLYVREFLRNNFGLNRSDLQAVLVGSKNTEKSLDIFNKFSALLKEANIPFTILKNGKNPINIAYKSDKDEIYISSISINKAILDKKSSLDAIKSSFERVLIADCDEIV